MLIIEGPDGSGKTTLAIFLHTLTRLPVHHAGGPPRDKQEFLDRVDYIKNNKGGIFDRFPPISEYVYGGLRSNPLFSDSELLDLQRSVEKWIIVYCRPPLLVIKGNALAQSAERPHKNSNHLEMIKANILWIVEQYDAVFKHLESEGDQLIIRYDYTQFGGSLCAGSTFSLTPDI
jgi:hypothetical protein